MEPESFKLKGLTGENVKVIGQMFVNVLYKDRSFVLPLVILNGKTKFTPLLGRNWLG